ncbi:MAG: GHKL domain-containing protein [Clostridiales bacterium]|nr:GHKL domain-containing protein [Clostridiales bacterium]
MGSIAILIVSAIVFSFLLNTRPARTLLACIIAFVFMAILEIVTVNLIILVFGVQPSIILEMNFYRMIAIVISKSFFFLLVFFVICRLELKKYVMIGDIYPITFIAFFNVIIIFMTLILFKHIEVNSARDYSYVFAMSLAVLMFSWIIYTILKRIKLQNEREIIWNMKEKEHKNQEFYIKSMQDILETIKAQRHDFGNYIGTLYGLIQIGRFDEAKKFIAKLGNEGACMNEIIETNHPVITAIINIKRQRAISKKIDLEIFTELPEKISIDYIDLSIILGNLLDNALEACEKVQEEERAIELFMNVRGRYLIIKIANSKTDETECREKNILGRFTTKKDFVNHAYGLNNIKQVVDQYNGTMTIEDEGDNFKVDIALLLDEDDK